MITAKLLAEKAKPQADAVMGVAASSRPYASSDGRHSSAIDDRRSEPLRHALIQKPDFQFEVDPWMSSPFRANWDLSPEETLKYSNMFLFKVVSSLDQRVPTGFLLWNREDHAFAEFPYLPATQANLF